MDSFDEDADFSLPTPGNTPTFNHLVSQMAGKPPPSPQSQFSAAPLKQTKIPGLQKMQSMRPDPQPSLSKALSFGPSAAVSLAQISSPFVCKDMIHENLLN